MGIPNSKKSPLVTMGRPIFIPQITPPCWPIHRPISCLIHGPVRPTMPNGIRIRSAVFPRSTEQTDPQTNRSSAGKFDHYRPLSLYRQQRGLKNVQYALRTLCMVVLGPYILHVCCWIFNKISVWSRFNKIDAQVGVLSTETTERIELVLGAQLPSTY